MGRIIKALAFITNWLERRRDRKRYNRGRRKYEEAVGKNLRDVERHIKSRTAKKA